MEGGREKTFREIYEQNAGRLYQYIVRRVGDSSHAEDILQDVAVALLFYLNKFLPGYPGNAKLIRAWLFGVARNKTRQFWRKNYRMLEMEVSMELLPDMEDHGQEMADGELVLPDWLTEVDRKLIYLKCKGYSLKEISDQIGISYGGCRMRNVRLTEKLKEYFGN